jgi:hypothetical protein
VLKYYSHSIPLLTTNDRRREAMAIIRVTRKQIEAANKAREAALKKDNDFRRFEEQRQHFEEDAKAREAALQKELKTAAARKEDQSS